MGFLPAQSAAYAFHYFGGVPEEILYDQVKTVVFYQLPLDRFQINLRRQ